MATIIYTERKYIFISMEKNNQKEKITKMTLHTPSASARGMLHSSGKLEVLQGSTMKAYAEKEMAKMKTLFDQLVAKKVLVVAEDRKVSFAKTYNFKSANEAASFLLHRGGDNSTCWKKAEVKKAEAPAEKKKEKPALAKQAVKKPKAKTVHKEKVQSTHTAHTEKKQTSFAKKSASANHTGGSRRKDPRNPRGIRPQGNDALRVAQSVETKGYVRFAGMGQGVKVKH
jgi:hypothetical protein